MKYFITGATGFIGGHLARRLASEGHTIHTLVRDPDKAAELRSLGIEIFKGDITDRSTIAPGMEGVDGIFHLAAWYKVGVKDNSMAYVINVNGTRNVLETMKELGIKKGVYTSTLAINSDTHGKVVDESYRFNGKHLSVYDQTKWTAHYEVAEKFIADALPLVIVMPGLVYGPGDPSAGGEMLRQYLQRKLPVIPRRTAYAWAHIDDIVTGHILAMQKGRAGESYIIAGPNHPLTEALEIAEKITGIKAPPVRLPVAMMKAGAALSGIFGRFLPIPELYSGEVLRESAGTTYIATNAKAREQLGYDPRPLEVGLEETLNAMRKENY